MYTKKRSAPAVAVKIVKQAKTPSPNRLLIYRPLNLWTNPLLRYQNLKNRSSIFLNQYNWKYNTYYHVNNPWLSNQYYNRQLYRPTYINSWYYIPTFPAKNKIRYTTTKRKTPSNNYFNSKKGRQQNTFDSNYHNKKTHNRSKSTKLKKKY